jgi:hypothetical protein
MATLSITVPANANAGAVLRRLAFQIQQAAAGIPDNANGASTVMTVNDSPTGGIASVQITAGPYTSSTIYIA